MNGTTWAQIATNALGLFTPQVEGALIVIALTLSLGYGLLHGHYGWFWTSLVGSAVMVTVVSIAQTVFGVSGIG